MTRQERRREYLRKYRAANRERRAAYSKTWDAANRERIRTVKKAYREANREKCLALTKAWNIANPERRSATSKTWRVANPEKRRAARKTWEAAHPERVAEKEHRRRARKRAATVESIPVAVLKALRAAPCTYCRAPGPSEVDHMIPLARGGKHTPDNLTSACGSCNRRKGAKTAEEFRQLRVVNHIKEINHG